MESKNLNEKGNALNDLMATTMNKIRDMVDSNTIVGQPIQADGVTLIPISRMSFGFGTGGGEYTQNKNFAGGGGAGVRVEPVAFLIIENGVVRVMPVAVPAYTTAERIVERVPEVVSQITSWIDKKSHKEEMPER